MFSVTTSTGLKMILANAGKDSDGNQLWKQIKVEVKGRECGRGPDCGCGTCWPGSSLC